jgi:hypothetical protein
MSGIVPGSTFPTAEAVLNLSRALLNDMQVSAAGQILTDDAPFTIEYLNAGIESVQEYLANNGITANLKDNFILTPVTPVATQDPSVQCYISTDGYFDGVAMHATPALPPDVIVVLRAWERVTGSGQWFQPLHQPQDGLPSHLPGPYLQEWEWRQDRINIVGSTNTEDIRIRYEASLAIVGTNANFSETVIPIKRSTRALAYSVVAQYCNARGAAQAPAMDAAAIQFMDQLVNRQARRDTRIGYRMGGYGHGSIDGSLSGSFK